MAGPHAEQELELSVLDRLINLDPRNRIEVEPLRAVRLRDVKAALKRDLEWLLNSRVPPIDIPIGSEASKSMLCFGLPDFTHFSLENPKHTEALEFAITEAIRRFEPRLIEVAVTLSPGSALNREVNFRIDAMLRVEPNPEPVYYDSRLRLSTRDFVIED